MTDDTRQARIEAALKAYDDVYCTFWPSMPIRERVQARGIAAMGAAIDAADAAAAPAVGVTVDAAEALIDELLASLDGSADWEFDDEEVTRYEAARNRIIALLTAQPEPGTHDDAGQPAEGGV